MAAAGGSDGTSEQHDDEFDDGDLGYDPDASTGHAVEEDEEKEERNSFVREFRKNYIKASGFDDSMKELDAIEEVYFDPDLDDETRTTTIHGLWLHGEGAQRQGHGYVHGEIHVPVVVQLFVSRLPTTSTTSTLLVIGLH